MEGGTSNETYENSAKIIFHEDLNSFSSTRDFLLYFWP